MEDQASTDASAGKLWVCGRQVCDLRARTSVAEMGCRQSAAPHAGGGQDRYNASPNSTSEITRGSCGNSEGVLPKPVDDVLSFVVPFGGTHFAVSGIDGWVYFYDWQRQSLGGKFRAHKKAVNRLLSLHDRGGRILTASTDATVRIWSGGDALPSVAASGVEQDAVPALTLEGHRMAVSALDIVPNDGCALFTGSRDCTVRLWDLERGIELQQSKILRNVVTAVRWVPLSRGLVAQASEDLQLRLWDAASGGLKMAHAVHAGPDQLVCLDVTDDGNYVVCGSKGFSRENCVVKIFDVRSGLRQLASLPCAEQTIEALRMAGPDKCLFASKDGNIRAVALNISEAAPAIVTGSGMPLAQGAYTALGLCRRDGGEGPVAMAASVASGESRLELLSWDDAELRQPAKLLAATG